MLGKDSCVVIVVLACTCPLYTGARSHYFPHLSRLDRPARLEDILSESPCFFIESIMSFLDVIGILRDTVYRHYRLTILISWF